MHDCFIEFRNIGGHTGGLVNGFILGNRYGFKTFEVTADAIMLVDDKLLSVMRVPRCVEGVLVEALAKETPEEGDDVDACYEAILFLAPPNAADTVDVRQALFWRHRFEIGGDGASILRSRYMNEPTPIFPFVGCPILCHEVQVPVDDQVGLLIV